MYWHRYAAGHPEFCKCLCQSAAQDAIAAPRAKESRRLSSGAARQNPMLFNTAWLCSIFRHNVATGYFVLPERFRRPFLLAASYYFYMCWSVRYIAVIIAITLVDYCAGIGIEQARGAQRRLILTLSILCNFGLLFAFKYANFFGATLNTLTGAEIPQLHWLLPVGISFHTFQAVSYTVDVYRGKVKAERSLLTYGLYVAFFPQMVAGPIERPENLLPQLHRPKRFDYNRLRTGLETALWGLIKKTVVADLVAPLVNTVYAHPRDFAGTMLCLATVLFAVQIYCDFSGYSDMAVGLARILGYDLTINFRQPYSARTVAEILAAVAHLAIQLVSRLPLHSARRQSGCAP